MKAQLQLCARKATSYAMDVANALSQLFEAERNARTIHRSLAHNAKKDALIAALQKETKTALAMSDDDKNADEVALRLVRISGLLNEVEGPAAVDLLIDILACEEPEARHAAGEALEDIAFDRFKEVALGIERALDRLPVGSPALEELPYLLAEVAEPGSLKLLGRFLQHKDADAVAAAIEALAELGDPSARPMLKALEKDSRQVQLDEEEESDSPRVTLGDLAVEAGEILAELEPEARPAIGANTQRDPRGRGKR
jgi:HEAT repeat protein